ncbi:MAG: alpha-glucan family phosphorylase [Chromatiales bacterium]
MAAGSRLTLEVQPLIPAPLARLPELASNLAYSWNRRARLLFANLDRQLWHECGHNPRVFLRRVSQSTLEEAAASLVYLQDYKGVLSDHDTYMAKPPEPEITHLLDPQRDLIAYFCAEFGLHESLPIYSGGLGILAGDHCKAASDLGAPFVAVGLLYRAGYVDQLIDAHGNQQLRNKPIDFADLPITPVLDERKQQRQVQIDLPGRAVKIKIWQAQIGHIRLVLLDADCEDNRAEDRLITQQLYGGDRHMRIQQELLLGVGGVRALRAINLAPTVWHINEGHAAFLVLERVREFVLAGMEFGAALERTAAGTVFTTHTPVAAGHDIFEHDMISEYFRQCMPHMGTSVEELLRLGASPANNNGFNMTALALRASRLHNGVSRIHGAIASQTENYVWPDIAPEENPLDYITNGIHVPTFLAPAWANLFDLRFGSQWRNELRDEAFWNRLDDLPDATFWSTRQLLRYDLIRELRQRLIPQMQRNGCSQSEIERHTRLLDPDRDVCLLGFARRFATYKRATLLFAEPERLARLLNDPERPALIVFAGKAHPRDGAGQALIRAVHEYSQRPEFEGRIVLVEGYDIALARRLVTGVDVWLNVPEYPLEASGTSGMKAGINGVLNVSILDGWWGEGYQGDNGWAIAPHGPETAREHRDRLEAQDLLDLLEREVLALYYRRNRYGFPADWVRMTKASMRSIISRYNSQRMFIDYVRKLYGPASRQQQWFAENHSEGAFELARWKQHIAKHWPAVSVRLVEQARERITLGEEVRVAIAARLGALRAKDVHVELVVGHEHGGGRFATEQSLLLTADSRNDQGETLFSVNIKPEQSGLRAYQIRIYPYHSLLTHRFETGLMLWV